MQGIQPGALRQPKGLGGGREVPEEGATHIPVADACGCMAEAHTTL